MIFETHAHYDDEKFKNDQDETIKRVHDSGVDPIINVGASIGSTKTTLALADKYDFIYAAVGVHPSDISGLNEETFDWLKKQTMLEKTVAVGEIGLDHHWPVPRQEQYDLFEAQLQLAKELDLPVSVHDREAHAEMYELLRKYKPRGALHCYSGSADDAAWLVAQGMYLGFGGAVTYKGAKRAAKVLAAIPHEMALLETDCPYMAPEPVRRTRNDSRNIAHVAAYIGTLWEMDAQAVLDVTAANARRCFGV